MKAIRVRRAGVLLACLGGAALVATPIGAFAAPGHQSATTAKSHPKGYYVNGQLVTTSTQPAAFVRDSNGGEHVITTVPSPSAPGDQGHMDYITRKAGTTKWTSHQIPGLISLAGKVQVEEHLSTDGTRVFVVFYTCNGVFVADTSLTATRMPNPTLVQSADTCADPTPSANPAPTSDAIAAYGHQIGILLPDQAQEGRPAIFVGKPGVGQTFSPGKALPTTDAVTPVLMTRDESNGQTVVVGTGNDGTNAGIYVFTQRYLGASWTGPTLIATLDSPTRNYTIDSVTSFRGSIWVGLAKPLGTGHPKHDLYLVHGTPSDQWVGAIPLKNSTAQDGSLQLFLNPTSNHLHAVFTRVDPSSKTGKSGILHEILANQKWSKLMHVSHWYHDTATQVAVTPKGVAVVGYEQR